MVILFLFFVVKDWGHLHCIRVLHDCTSVRFVYLRSSRKYLSLSSNKHATLHQMSVHSYMHCIHILIMSNLQAHNHIIIKVTRTSHNHIIISTSHVHQSKENIDNDMYTGILGSKSRICISKEWVSTKMGATRAQSIKMVQNGSGTPIDT